ncbi:unnamed protein product, partial [Staurois parvus]
CPIVGVSGGRNSAPSLVSVGGGIVPHHYYQDKGVELTSTIGGGVSGKY